MTKNDNDRYHRQMLLFGAPGQRKIGRAKVALLGLGGLGSHLAQQLAYLGVLNYILAEDDKVERTNLNRFIGASPEDVGKSKVEVVAKMIRTVQPKAVISVRREKVTEDNVESIIVDSTIVLGSFDNDLPRLTVLSKSAELQIPYIDLASDVRIDQDRTFYGGRIITSGTSRGCLFCLGELDQREIREARLSPEERRSERRIYGIDTDTLEITGPSVVSLNGVVASLAMTELMVHLTGLRVPHTFLMYQAGDLVGFEKNFGVVKLVNRSLAPTCPYCFKYGRIQV